MFGWARAADGLSMANGGKYANLDHDSERSEIMPNGTVKFFNTAKGFGFIESDDGGKDVFVHATALEAAGIRMLKEGDRVSFVLEDDRRGRGKQAGQLKQI